MPGFLKPNKSVETNRRPASALGAGQEFESTACAPPLLTAAVAHLCRSAVTFAHLRNLHLPSFTALQMHLDCAGWPHKCRWKEKRREVKDGAKI
jgi:hypothetical protein